MQRGTPWAKALFAASVAGAISAAVASAMGYPVSAWWLVGCAMGLLIAVGAGVFLMSSGLFARPILGVEPGRSAGRLALTFDDGPDEQHTRAVMDALEARGHTGTFFVIGKRAEEHPALVAEIVRRGHGLGNHTYAHSWMTPAMAVGRLVEDLERAGAVLAQATAPLGRPAPRCPNRRRGRLTSVSD